MRCLLDSHIIFWSMFETQRLPKRYADILASKNTILHVSLMSLWELAIKHSLGKLDAPNDFYTHMAEAATVIVPLTLSHIQHVVALPFYHRDPFDRMLIAQAHAENLVLLTDDKAMAQYKDIITLL